MQTRDTSKLIEYTMELERENSALHKTLKNERQENDRLRKLRERDRDLIAQYRALVEGYTDGL